MDEIEELNLSELGLGKLTSDNLYRLALVAFRKFDLVNAMTNEHSSHFVAHLINSAVTLRTLEEQVKLNEAQQIVHQHIPRSH